MKVQRFSFTMSFALFPLPLNFSSRAYKVKQLIISALIAPARLV